MRNGEIGEKLSQLVSEGDEPLFASAGSQRLAILKVNIDSVKPILDDKVG